MLMTHLVSSRVADTVRSAVRIHRVNMPAAWFLILLPTGIRVSLYNAISEADVDKLVAYIDNFIGQELATKTE